MLTFPFTRVLAASLALAALGACSKTNELVPYGSAQEAATPLPPNIKTSGPLTVKVTPPPAGSTGPVTPISCEGKPEKVVQTGVRASGTFGGVQTGDGTRVILRQQGKVEYYRVADDAIAFFFLAHKAQRPSFEVVFDSLDLCVSEAGGYVPSQRMTSASTGGVSHTQWWAKLDEAARAAARAGFQKYVDDAFAK